MVEGVVLTRGTVVCLVLVLSQQKKECNTEYISHTAYHPQVLRQTAQPVGSQKQDAGTVEDHRSCPASRARKCFRAGCNIMQTGLTRDGVLFRPRCDTLVAVFPVGTHAYDQGMAACHAHVSPLALSML